MMKRRVIIGYDSLLISCNNIMTKVLYIFFTHILNLDNVLPRIKIMMEQNGKDYIVVKGQKKKKGKKKHKSKLKTEDKSIYQSEYRILTVPANDKYEGLPEKVFKTFTFLVESPEFSEYTHFFKIDDDMTITKPIDSKDLMNINYAGLVSYQPGDREWHIGKCSQSSKWNKQKYTGRFVPWCLGGYGYIISRDSINAIKDETSYQEHILEDVCIGIMLYDKDIHPTPINIREYVISPDHQ